MKIWKYVRVKKSLCLDSTDLKKKSKDKVNNPLIHRFSILQKKWRRFTKQKRHSPHTTFRITSSAHMLPLYIYSHIYNYWWLFKMSLSWKTSRSYASHMNEEILHKSTTTAAGIRVGDAVDGLAAVILGINRIRRGIFRSLWLRQVSTHSPSTR